MPIFWRPFWIFAYKKFYPRNWLVDFLLCFRAPFCFIKAKNQLVPNFCLRSSVQQPDYIIHVFVCSVTAFKKIGCRYGFCNLHMIFIWSVGLVGLWYIHAWCSKRLRNDLILNMLSQYGVLAIDFSTSDSQCMHAAFTVFILYYAHVAYVSTHSKWANSACGL